MRQIRAAFKGQFWQMVLAPLFKLLEAVLELLVPTVMARIIDVGIRNNERATILRNGVLLLVLAVLGVVAAIVCQYFAARVAGQFGNALRSSLFRHVLTLSNAQTAPYGAGGLITRMTNDTNLMQTGINHLIRLGTRVPFLLVGSIVMAFAINARIALIFVISTPLIVLVLYAIMHKTVPSYKKIQEGQDDLSRRSGEALEGVRVIRAFSRQQQEQQEYEEAAEGLSRLIIRVGRISAALNPLTTIIINVAVMGIVWVGAGFSFEGSMLPGSIIALVNYMNQTLLALVVAANLVVLFTRAVASTRRVADLFELQPAIVGGTRQSGQAGQPKITYEGVTFAYTVGAEPALENLGFSVQPGQMVGIIGGTGSGKSTLVNLMLRYYDPDAGRLLLDGADLREYTLHALRGKIGLVPQKAALFTGSVRYNLCLSKPDATDEELWHALEMAQAADFVKDKPDGLDTRIEEGGKNLSGGQKQRLTIARALVRRPEVLILDDSSSALDYATDAALRRALRGQGAGMTTFIVSQRAASIRDADLILVLDDGRLVGAGRHAQLVETNSLYREICTSQGLLQGEVS